MGAPLYELVGAGMAVYARAAHRTTALDLERLRLAPGTVVVCAHLSDYDVPVLAGTIYRGLAMWRHREITRPAFAVSNDLLEPGFFAGYPPRVPRPLRRLLYPVGIGPILTGRVRCLPVMFSDRLRLIEALRAAPGVELAALPAARRDALLDRAAALGRPLPRLARDVLGGDYADLLWVSARREELAGPEFADVWAARVARSAAALRGLVAHVRDGGALVLFPHGEPSPDGGIAPLDPRAGRLLHVLRPAALQPVGLAYDPLVPGRPRAFVAAGAPLGPPPRRGGERDVLAALRAATPVTCGLVLAAAAVAAGAVPDAARARAAVEDALTGTGGRPLEPALRDPATRARRIEQARAALTRLGLGDRRVRRAARTYSSAVAPP